MCVMVWLGFLVWGLGRFGLGDFLEGGLDVVDCDGFGFGDGVGK